MKIYHSLFSSHLTYGITCWGGTYKSKLQRIFNLQKRCGRILSGEIYSFDHPEYYSTCSRARSNRRENYFITNSPSKHQPHLFTSHPICGTIVRVFESTNIDFSSAVAKFKKIIKFALLSTQKLYKNNIWCLSNYDISEIRF